MQLKVFISSRLKELEEERTAVEEAVSELWNNENLPFTIWRWESAKELPTGKHPDKVQSKGVRNSDIYVLILGSEYGDREYGKPPTQKEYDIACSELEDGCILIYIKEVEKREENLENWVKELKCKHTTKSFKKPYQLKDLIKTRLRDLWNKGKWKANIATIQSVLRKGETFEGDFFKKEPEWIDFEEGYVVERKEVEEIINNLENDNIQLVLGEPASGKSVILKNIGFKLAKKNRDVYVVELKKHSRDEVKRYFDDILRSSNEKVFFIVDDAHLFLSDCERLIRDFKNRKSKAKLIIGSRETEEISEGHPKKVSEFEYLSKTDIHAEDVTEEIIRRLLKRKYGFSDERIKTVSINLEKYKKDLWHLSWTLKGYNPKKDSIEEKEIYEKVKDSIRNINAAEGKLRINAEDVFLPLSVFYRFEIPVERDFLEEQLEIEEDKIDQLKELSEIIEMEEIGRNQMLSLNHSSVAELYFKTYQAYPSLGRRTKKKILKQRDEDLQHCLFYKYMTSTDPRNAIDVVAHLGSWVTLSEKLIRDERVEESIKNGIEKEEDIGKIGDCAFCIKWVNEEAGLKLAYHINIDTLLSKIEKEEDIEKIGDCVNAIVFASEEVGLKLVNHVNIDTLLSKIEKEGDIEIIGWCVSSIARASEEVGLKLVDIVSLKIEKEEDIGKIGECVIDIAKASEEAGLKLVNPINIDALLSKIEKEEDIGIIGWCVYAIAFASEEARLKLVNHINIDTLLSKIEKEGDIEIIGWCVSSIAKTSEEVALKLVDTVSSKIEKEEDIEEIGYCMDYIAKECEEIALEILNRLNPKIREELQKGGWLK